MERPKSKVKRITVTFAAFLFALTGLTVFGAASNTSAASGGFKVVNNCSKSTVFGYNRNDTPPGTGAYYTVAKGATRTVHTGSGIFRVELPKGVYRTFVYGGNYNTLRMC